MQKLCSGLGSSVGETITLKVFEWDLTFGLGKSFWGIIKMNWFQLHLWDFGVAQIAAVDQVVILKNVKF